MDYKPPRPTVTQQSLYPENVWLLIVDYHHDNGAFMQTEVREVYASHFLADQAFRRYVTGYSRRKGKKCTYDFITETKAVIWYNGQVTATVTNSRRVLRTKLSTRNRRCA